MEDAKFTYVHQPSESIEIHHISLNTHSSLLLRAAALLLLLLPISLHLFLAKLLVKLSLGCIADEDISVKACPESKPFSSFVQFMLTLLFLHFASESVLIILDFGIQLETFYRRKVVRRFVPIGKLLQPTLNECVTPVTCKWSLSMILRGEEELLLELRIPVKVLLPVWEALCATINNAEKHPTAG
uniref:Phosphatidylinositol N-acetylglucosaminyltransferase subunit H conserved domain-containing protein n=1 Tax=Kalanchoe fedtschenkoi TaxID=63787 RepID=A0A7N0UWN7_KALFE